jgi:hypothetical protein
MALLSYCRKRYDYFYNFITSRKYRHDRSRSYKRATIERIIQAPKKDTQTGKSNIAEQEKTVSNLRGKYRQPFLKSKAKQFISPL